MDMYKQLAKLNVILLLTGKLHMDKVHISIALLPQSNHYESSKV